MHERKIGKAIRQGFDNEKHCARVALLVDKWSHIWSHNKVMGLNTGSSS